MDRERLQKILVRANLSVKEAIKKMDETGEKILFVVEEGDRLLGSITDGDLRRWVLKEGSLAAGISSVYNPRPVTVTVGEEPERVREMMIARKIDAIPVVDSSGILKDLHSWSDFFSKQPNLGQVSLPVLIMAGGKGTRLDPFTRILPKPLIPFGEKPIVEIIMERFREHGCHDFYLTVNYKGKMIQAYFDHPDSTHRVKFVWEEQPTGTAGSIRAAAPLIDAANFFVTNCDIIVKADYSDIFRFHEQKQNDVTVVGSMQHLSVPFGVLEMRNGGHLESLTEKPEYDLLVNTGFYVVNRKVADLIPADCPFDFTELLASVKGSGGRVGVYPVSQQSWVDVGQWQEYNNAVRSLEL